MNNNSFYNLERGHKYHDVTELEDFNITTDIPISFNYLDEKYLYDGYFRLTDDGCLRFKYCTKINDIFHTREFDDLETIDDLVDIIDNQFSELIWVNTEEGDDEECDDEEGDDDDEE
jgi:hypothetical protein